MALELAFSKLPQIVEIAIISLCVMASLFATFPWSRSFWTVFLYLAGVMGERPARAQDSPNATPQAAVPPTAVPRLPNVPMPYCTTAVSP